MGRKAKGKGTKTKQRFCEECGAKLGKTRFCEECGTPVDEVKAKRPAPPEEEEEVPELAPIDDDDEEIPELAPVDDDDDTPELAPLEDDENEEVDEEKYVDEDEDEEEDDDEEEYEGEEEGDEEERLKCELCKKMVPLDQMYTCQICDVPFCATCEESVEKEGEFKGKPLRFDSPICEKCYDESYDKQVKKIKAKLKDSRQGKGRKKRPRDRFMEKRRPRRDILDEDDHEADEKIDEFFEEEGVKVFNPIGAHEYQEEVYHEVPSQRRDRDGDMFEGVRGDVIKGPDQVQRKKKPKEGRGRPKKGKAITCPCGEKIRIGERPPKILKCPACGKTARLRR